ncbi:hypothetical protein [Staphylococcus hominis]
MGEDTKRFGGNGGLRFRNLKTEEGLDNVIEWIEGDGLVKGLG